MGNVIPHVTPLLTRRSTHVWCILYEYPVRVMIDAFPAQHAHSIHTMGAEPVLTGPEVYARVPDPGCFPVTPPNFPEAFPSRWRCLRTQHFLVSGAIVRRLTQKCCCFLPQSKPSPVGVPCSCSKPRSRSPYLDVRSRVRCLRCVSPHDDASLPPSTPRAASNHRLAFERRPQEEAMTP